MTACGALDEIDIGAATERIKRLRAAIADRRRQHGDPRLTASG
jgi:hypothetical protein